MTRGGEPWPTHAIWFNGTQYVEKREYDALRFIFAAAIVAEGGEIFIPKHLLIGLDHDLKMEVETPLSKDGVRYVVNRV